MVDEFLKTFAKLIADNPDNVKVKRVDVDDTFCEVIIYADKGDTGKLIGRDGKMINSIKTVISACKAKDGKSYRITVKANEE